MTKQQGEGRSLRKGTWQVLGCVCAGGGVLGAKSYCFEFLDLEGAKAPMAT